MVLRFNNTESFENPVGLAEIRNAFQHFEKKNPNFQSPSRLSEKTFFAIYKYGSNR